MFVKMSTPFARTFSLRAMSSSRNMNTSPATRLAAPSGSSTSQKGPWADRPTAARLNRYMVVAEDYSDAGANARRLEVRERHLEQARNGKQVGRIELGGALLKRDFDQIDEEVGPGPILGGSILVVLGESIEDVRERVMQDEYVQSNVWDLSKLKIYPFLQAPLIDVSAKPEQPMEDAQDSTSLQRSATLGQLRQDIQAGKGPKIITLGSLRKVHQRSMPSAT